MPCLLLIVQPNRARRLVKRYLPLPRFFATAATFAIAEALSSIIIPTATPRL